MTKKKRRTAIVPRVVFTVAVSAVAVVPCLDGCGTDAPPTTATTRAPAPSLVASVAVVPPTTVALPPTTVAAEPEAIDAGPPPEAPAPTKRRRVRPPQVPPDRLHGVLAYPDDRRWELMGVAARSDGFYGVALE